MPQPLKPRALKPGDAVRLLSLASPIKQDLFRLGCEELQRLGFKPQFDEAAVLARTRTFAGPPDARLSQLRKAFAEPATRALFCTRGGYGSTYLLDCLTRDVVLRSPKILLGCSDITSLQIYLWEKFGWVSFYGPMVATNFSRGAGKPHGYDRESLLNSISGTAQDWALKLDGEALVSGEAEGVLLGGCLTLIETTLGTPWELKTEGAILVIEDRGMKPYAIDRSLTHLRQAGKFRGITGIVLGDFPDCQVQEGDETVREVIERIFKPLGIPVVFGAPIGHTERSMLTLPLGVRARLNVNDVAQSLNILEPPCES
ncbi:MAG TPA: LD-carboxypeptidase [Candidatus Acidoferrales bacterium]|nr:LD-carboxypeptidase [Candidatus Acidoferrales bacterium]